ncbi:MAG: HPF/RaiA family ribosome-associated protein [Gemmataceae bacterium]|nr:HPF/RaiA family ribosome-associated protein [Gemmata sp.]MDW8197911.1 HPF/RaiA family ribosome-associated protein [Gemmataceae bacterium]
MLVQVSTDNHIDGSLELKQKVQAEVEAGLARFRNRLTRAEVHLSDENSTVRKGSDAIRCRLEARPASHQPVVVSADADTVDQAVAAAIKKMQRLLDSTFDKLDDVRS